MLNESSKPFGSSGRWLRPFGNSQSSPLIDGNIPHVNASTVKKKKIVVLRRRGKVKCEKLQHATVSVFGDRRLSFRQATENMTLIQIHGHRPNRDEVQPPSTLLKPLDLRLHRFCSNCTPHPPTITPAHMSGRCFLCSSCEVRSPCVARDLSVKPPPARLAWGGWVSVRNRKQKWWVRSVPLQRLKLKAHL